MPLYEYYENAENKVKLPQAELSQIVTGTAAACRTLVEQTAGKVVAIDGWYGVKFPALIDALKQEADALGVKVAFADFCDCYLPLDKIDDYRARYITDDPSFGWVNTDGTLTDLIDMDKVAKVAADAQAYKAAGVTTFVCGQGASIDEVNADVIVYADYTMQPMLWQMWDGELVTFGKRLSGDGYNWKAYYYNDFYLLYRNKKAAFAKMDYFIDAVKPDDLKLLPNAVYQHMIDELVKQPIKQVKILQPGPWGAYRYKQLWKVDGLECNAWNELAGIELSVLVDVGAGAYINIPSQDIMQRPEQLVGPYATKTWPDLLPLQVWLDDGYFDEEVPYERGSMPMHDHPSTQYVRRNFNEPLGRYETYYIVESYKGSSTWMGYKESADLEEWERLCRESENKKVIPNWQDFVKRWDTNVGDLFLIPPGTTHGHGGNQMILEMDTGPSVAGTEYSFFTYDFARNTWDDKSKTMTAKPMTMHLKHSFDNQKWIRETRVKDVHRARPITQDGNGQFRKDQYTTISEMPFHIERVFMEKRAENDTEGKFMHMVTLTEGKRVTIRSIDHPEYSTTIDRLQACIIPAGFGRHEYINEDGSHAMVVIIRLKQG